jgi:DNA-directed RNA polymerase subunit RPC12/RpoP
LKKELSGSAIFLTVARYICSDGKVDSEEFAFLRKLAPAINISTEQANSLANQAIKEYREKSLEGKNLAKPEEIYRTVLSYFLKDDSIDSVEQQTLDLLRQLLNIQSDDSEEIVESINNLTSSPNAVASIVNNTALVSDAANNELKSDSVESQVNQINFCQKGAIKPLICSKCKGVVPLRPTPTVKCLYCETVVNLPIEYLEAIAVRKTFQKRKKDVQNFAAELGKAPSTIGGHIAQIPESYLTIFIVILFFLGPATMGPHNPFCSMVNFYFEQFRGENLLDALTMPQQVLLTFLPFAFFLSLLFSMIYRLRRRVFTMGMIRASLTALPPIKPGSPYICRQCGAPLSADDDAVAVTCIYCSTDNLLHIPPNWLSANHKEAKQVGMSFAKGQKVYLKESLRGLETLIALMLGSLALAFIHVEIIKRRYYWSNHNPLKQMLRNRSGLINDSAKSPILRLSTWTLLSKSTFPENSFIIPLHKAEKLSLSWRPGKKQKLNISEIELSLFLEQSFKDGGNQKLLEKITLSRGKTFNFLSTLGARYRLSISPESDGEVEIFAEISKGSK